LSNQIEVIHSTVQSNIKSMKTVNIDPVGMDFKNKTHPG